MLHIRKVHHVAIICSDYAKSKDFYVNILGFTIIRETYRAERHSYKLDLNIDDHTQIELFSFPDSPPRASYPESLGLRHLAFEVDDVALAIAHLQSHGIIAEPIRVDALTHKQFTFFADPDGLPLEFYSYT